MISWLALPPVTTAVALGSASARDCEEPSSGVLVGYDHRWDSLASTFLQFIMRSVSGFRSPPVRLWLRSRPKSSANLAVQSDERSFVHEVYVLVRYYHTDEVQILAVSVEQIVYDRVVEVMISGVLIACGHTVSA